MQKFILSVLMGLGLTTSFELLGKEKGLSLLYKAIVNKPYLILFAILGIYMFLGITDKVKQKTNVLQKLVSILFAISTWFTEIYSTGTRSINSVITGNRVGLLYSVLFILSIYMILESCQKILTYFYYQEKVPIIENVYFTKIEASFEKHPFLFPFLVFSVVWLVVAVTAYPSVFMGDSVDQIEQYLGLQTRTAAHPVASTLFVGSLVKLGISFGNASAGLFIYTLVQVLFIATCLAYGIFLVYTISKQSQLLIFSTLLLAIIPSVNGSIILATKDIVFSGFFVVFMATLATYFYARTYYNENHLYVVNGVSIVGMLLFRYNTLYFIVLTIVVFVVGGLILKRKNYKLSAAVPVMIISLVCGSLVNNFLVGQFAEAQPKPNRREMLSLPFQHTARFIQYHEDEISSEDKKIIDTVLDYDTIKERYSPARSDAVKRTHNEEATSSEMQQYFKLVGRQALAHPLLTIESVMASHGNLFNVNQSVNWYYANGLVMDDLNEKQLASYARIGLVDSSISLKFNNLRNKLYMLWDKLPILSQLNNYGTYIFVMLAIFVLWLRDKKFLLAALVIPMGAFLGTLIAGPTTLGYIRYILPLILFTPLLFVLSINTLSRKERF